MLIAQMACIALDTCGNTTDRMSQERAAGTSPSAQSKHIICLMADKFNGSAMTNKYRLLLKVVGDHWHTQSGQLEKSIGTNMKKHAIVIMIAE